MNGTGYKDEGPVYSGHKWNADSPIGNADAHCVACAYPRLAQIPAGIMARFSLAERQPLLAYSAQRLRKSPVRRLSATQGPADPRLLHAG